MFRHVLPLAIPAVLGLLLTACGSEEPTASVARPVLVVQPVPAGALVDTFPGEVRARFEPELGFRIGGKMSKRLVEVGERVRKDQPLAELDPQDVRLQLEAMRAQVTAAEANLKLVRAERDRYKTLLARQLVSQSQYDNAENLYRAGEARLKQVRAEYNVASNQAGYAVLRAPQNGVIASRRGEVGQVLAAGQTVFVLAADGEREVLISLPEQSYERYRIGQQVEVELWSQPGRRYPGVIREMAPSADSQSRTFAARVSFVDTKVPAEPGQSARVHVQHNGEVPLSVPLSALSADNDQPYVWVVRGSESRLQRVSVVIGPYHEERAAILNGLHGDDWVVVGGVHLLREGLRVRPVDRDNRPVDLAGKE